MSVISMAFELQKDEKGIQEMTCPALLSAILPINKLLQGEITEVTSIELFHGSERFVGSKFNPELIGTKDGVSDALGCAIYLTSNINTAISYAKSSGSVVSVDVEIDPLKIANIYEAEDRIDLIKEVIQLSPICIQHLIDCGYDLAENLPNYNFEEGGYFNQEGKLIVVSQPDFAKRFGGLSAIFNNRMNYHSEYRTSDVVNIKAKDICRYSNDLFDALLTLEADMYRSNYATPCQKNKLANRDTALLMSELKIKHGIDMGLTKVGDEYHATIYNLDILNINKIEPVELKRLRKQKP